MATNFFFKNLPASWRGIYSTQLDMMKAANELQQVVTFSNSSRSVSEGVWGWSIGKVTAMNPPKQTPRQEEKVWKVFSTIVLLPADKRFIRTGLWKKIPIRGRLFTAGVCTTNTCPIDGCVEDMAHRLKHCTALIPWIAFIRKVFGMVFWNGQFYEPSRLIVDEPQLSISCVQGLLMWLGCRVLWVLRCDVIFRKETFSEKEFFTRLYQALSRYTTGQFYSISSNVAQHTRMAIKEYIASGKHVKMCDTPKPKWFPLTTNKKTLDKKKEEMRSVIHLIQEQLNSLVNEYKEKGFRSVYTDGSSDRVQEEWVGGYGIWYGPEDEMNESGPVPHNQATNNAAELWAAYRVMQKRKSKEKILLVTDSKYVAEGISQWILFWRLRGWQKKGKYMDNAAVWSRVMNLLIQNHDMVIVKVPSHIGIVGNEKVNDMAEAAMRAARPSEVVLDMVQTVESIKLPVLIRIPKTK